MEKDEEETTNNTNNKKEYLFSFARINKYFLIPFLCPVFCMISNVFIKFVIDEWVNSDFPISMIVCFCYLFGGLLYFVSAIRTKTEETRDNAIIYMERDRSSGSIKYIYNDGLKKDKCKIFGFLLIMSILLSLSAVCGLYSTYHKKKVFEKRMYLLFFIPLFSKYILKDKICSHQILSLLIAFIGMIILFIPTISVISLDDTIINICSFFFAIGHSFQLVLVKYLTHSYYLSPYLVLLFLGIFTSVFISLGYLIISLIKYKDLSLIIDCFDFSGINNGFTLIIYTLGGLIFGNLVEILSFLVIFYFSPTLLMVTDIISPMLQWLVLKFKDENALNNFFYGLGYLIVLFGSLIYNEIIICNFYGFNKYTKKCLDERQREESVLLRKTENKIQSGDSTHTDNESEVSENSDEDLENENKSENKEEV